jgi:hypothetical protein
MTKKEMIEKLYKEERSVAIGGSIALSVFTVVVLFAGTIESHIDGFVILVYATIILFLLYGIYCMFKTHFKIRKSIKNETYTYHNIMLKEAARACPCGGIEIKGVRVF